VVVRETSVTLWMFRSLIAYSNGVDDSWNCIRIEWSNPKLFQSAIPPQFIGSVFWCICWFAVCLLSVALLFHRLFVVSPPPHTHPFARPCLGHVFYQFIYASPLSLQDRKEKLKRCIIGYSWSAAAAQAHLVLYPLLVHVVAFGTVSLVYISVYRRG